MTSPVPVGIIGAGRIAQIHAKALAHLIPSANPVAIADINLDAAKQLGAELGIEKVYDDHRKIMEDPGIEAVIICSSTDTHAPFMIQAAEAGKHIFCEKPISIDLGLIDGALEVVERHGVKLQIGFHKRFDKSYREARQLIESGEYGDPRILNITSRDPAPPSLDYLKGSGGIFLDMTIHDFDMVRYLMGCEVDEVYAVGGVMVDPEIGSYANDIDTTVITLKFVNGAIGTINNCRQSEYGYDQRVEWFGSKGAIQVENQKTSTIVTSNDAGIASAKPPYFFLERYMDAYQAELEAFIRMLVDDTEPEVTGMDGRMPVVIGLAAWKSYREGRPVKLSEVDS